MLTASDADPAHARLDSDVVYRWTATGSTRTSARRARSRRTQGAFDVAVDLDVRLDGEPFFAREWRERIPRRLV